MDISEYFFAMPPVTRTLMAAMAAESILVHGEIISVFRIIFFSKFIFKFPPQIWRLFTPFLLTRPRLDFFFDLYFMYTYGVGLERNSPRFSGPGDFAVFVAFLWLAIMLPAGFLLGAYVFTGALLMAFIYTYSLDNRGRKVNFFFVPIPVKFLPWATLLVTLVRDGWPATLVQLTGVFAAHLYDFLTRLYPTFGGGTNYIRTPDWVRRRFGSRQATAAHGGYRFYPPANREGPGSGRQQQGQSSGLFSGGGAWGQRGPGRRLGGD